MRLKPIALLIALAALAAIVAAACGDDGEGQEASIHTQKGLSVAALAAGAQVGEETDNVNSDGDLATGAPTSDTGVGIESRGAIAPDIATFPYQSLQESQTGVTVQGFGSASVDADSAVLDLYFSGESVNGIDEPVPVPERDQTEPGSSSGVAPSSPETDLLQEAQPITEADLQPVVDAIAAQGVSSADIEVIVEPSYGDPYYGGSATIRVTVGNVDALEGIVDAATDAASGLENISFQGSNVSCTVTDCSSLEQAAMQAAVEDARGRSQTFASALGVGLGAVVGASHYSYSPYGAPCGSDVGGSYLLEGISYAEGQSSEVQLIATVTITFALQ